jgi:hypothetical protein
VTFVRHVSDFWALSFYEAYSNLHICVVFIFLRIYLGRSINHIEEEADGRCNVTKLQLHKVTTPRTQHDTRPILIAS